LDRFLVVGLGSMGKRRIRNLQALGHSGIAGFDTRPDRRAEAADTYGISTFETVEAALEEFRPDAMIVSTDPQNHLHYASIAFERGLPCFIEASVTDAEGVEQLAQKVAGGGPLIVPSCTMHYYAGPRKIRELLSAGAIGRPLNFTYHTGQWLPDWHPWEAIGDFYVSRRESGGCREIVPFELTWLNELFGDPEPVACWRGKLSDMPADIDDAYHVILRWPGGLVGSMTIEVLSRPLATRELRIIGTEGIIAFSADTNSVRHVGPGTEGWVTHDLGSGTVESGYINPEEPYIAEVRDFLDAARSGDPGRYPNTLSNDANILRTLDGLDSLGGQSNEL
jgi:predicted dehydrogenase